jgi:hypothetical protein
MAGMKPRHAAALALLAWYLLVPPHRICTGCSHYFQPDPPNASLDKWERVHTYDTVTKCRESLLWYQKKTGGWKLLKRPRIPYVATYGRCIASDDPRLKEK